MTNEQYTQQIRDEGYTVIRQAFNPEQVKEIKDDMARVFAEPNIEGDDIYGQYWRMLLFERSEIAQRYLEHRPILDVIEPILGANCHVIANAGWMTPAGYDGGAWHTDAGPHVPRPADVPWDDRIPYPIFVIGVMCYMTDVPLESGPTAVVPGSHKSGQPCPKEESQLIYNGKGPIALEAKAGDVALFCSDTWHAGTPHTGGEPRVVYQMHYGRRDISQRFRPFKNQRIPDEVVERATERGKELIGVHPISFYG